MENRKRLFLAICSVTLGASLCAFAGRAPAKTLHAALQAAGASPGGPWYQCTQAGQVVSYTIFAVANGLNSQGNVVCGATDYTGATTHTDCNGAATASTSLLEQAAFPTNSIFTMCSASGNWGTGAKCSATLYAYQTNVSHSCAQTSFTAMGALSN